MNGKLKRLISSLLVLVIIVTGCGLNSLYADEQADTSLSVSVMARIRRIHIPECDISDLLKYEPAKKDE